ncbi:hypothetical protein [Actinoplanes sp. L3-i22]|uniref:hypothetical protein n=1 Tax=Actinoplanes sp. L3-i22 TaxID=2836373 RepID=UPI001C76F590|nr:hypothetical protein [Actinoplanes sp. L3-i22]BCY08338.1 hypothetical protein L3i22_034260 [Actinoplanes sp. L3-i22]
MNKDRDPASAAISEVLYYENSRTYKSYGGEDRKTFGEPFNNVWNAATNKRGREPPGEIPDLDR